MTLQFKLMELSLNLKPAVLFPSALEENSFLAPFHSILVHTHPLPMADAGPGPGEEVYIILALFTQEPALQDRQILPQWHCPCEQLSLPRPPPKMGREDSTRHIPFFTSDLYKRNVQIPKFSETCYPHRHILDSEFLFFFFVFLFF